MAASGWATTSQGASRASTRTARWSTSSTSLGRWEAARCSTSSSRRPHAVRFWLLSRTALSPSTGGTDMRRLVALLAAAAAACGGSQSRSLQVGPPDASVPVPDAGTDAGTPDAGPPDAGPPPPPHKAELIEIHDSAGWKFYTGADGVPGNVMGASADEGGRLWVAGGGSGAFALIDGRFQQFSTPYEAISSAGGPKDMAFVGYNGIGDCEDEWDHFGDQHQLADPAIYKSGDADKLTLRGTSVSREHYDISSGPGTVAAEPAGREKLCTIYRVLYDRNARRVWFGANHGFAMGFVDSTMVFEHVHPAINDKNGAFMT